MLRPNPALRSIVAAADVQHIHICGECDARWDHEGHPLDCRFPPDAMCDACLNAYERMLRGDVGDPEC